MFINFNLSSGELEQVYGRVFGHHWLSLQFFMVTIIIIVSAYATSASSFTDFDTACS
jgi:hypothetical protein